MTYETYDDLSLALGRRLTNQEWVKLIAENFEVSNSVAKDMLHAMIYCKKMKEN